MIHHIENSRKSTQLCLNFSLTTATWEMEAVCKSRASSWEQTPLLEPSTRRCCPTPRRWTCPMLWWQQPNGCVTWGTNALSTWRQRRSSSIATGQGGKKCRPEGQDWQILRQVSPTQSHQSNGAAEKAVSAVRGLARTYLAVLKGKIPSSEVTTHSPMLPWTIRHVVWILTRYNVRRDTRMTPYEKIRGQKYLKKSCLCVNKFSLAVQERMSISFCNHG